MEQRSNEWFKARCGRITGSRFANAMAKRDTQNYRRLVDDLVDERLYQRVSEDYISPAMFWGMDHEDTARHWYSKTRNHLVTQVGFVVHPDFDYVGVSPDGLIGDDGLVEIKCPQPTKFQKVHQSQKLPSEYRWQVQGQLWVCQRRWLDFVCFYPPNKGVIVPVAFDSEDADRLAERCREINREVERRMQSRSPRMTTVRRASANLRSIACNTAPKQNVTRKISNTPSENNGKPGWVWLLVVIVVLVLIIL